MKALVQILNKCSTHIKNVLASCRKKITFMTREEYYDFVISTYNWTFNSIKNVKDYINHKDYNSRKVDKIYNSWQEHIKPELEEMFKVLIDENNKNLK